MVKCPVCELDTLSREADNEVCWVCLWEDEGQGDLDELAIYGGPNGNLSLKRARENFKKYYCINEPKNPEKYFTKNREYNKLIQKAIFLFNELEKGINIQIKNQLKEVRNRIRNERVKDYYNDWIEEDTNNLYAKPRTKEEQEKYSKILKKYVKEE